MGTDKIDVKKHFDVQWRKTFYPPKDISFVIYDMDIWENALELLKNSKRVVDLGCGGGTLLYNVAKVTNAELIGVDHAEIALEQLKWMVPRASILIEDLTQTSLPDASCDFALSSMTIEHIDDNKFLDEVYRILKPNGYFLVTTVLKKDGAWYFYKDHTGNTVLEPSHLREYPSLDCFVTMMKQKGFSIINAKTPPVKFPLVDPFLKMLFRIFKTDFFGRMPTTKPVEMIRKITRVPIPGYYAIEVIACKSIVNN